MNFTNRISSLSVPLLLNFCFFCPSLSSYSLPFQHLSFIASQNCLPLTLILSSSLSLSSVSTAQTVELVAHLHGNRLMFKEGRGSFTQLNAHRFAVWSHSHLISLSAGKTTSERRQKCRLKLDTCAVQPNMPNSAKWCPFWTSKEAVSFIQHWKWQGYTGDGSEWHLLLRSQCYSNSTVPLFSVVAYLKWDLSMTYRECCEMRCSVSEKKFVLDSLQTSLGLLSSTSKRMNKTK